MRVVILVGVPGSGKTTYAQNLAKEYPAGRVQILSMDRIRIAIWGSKRQYWLNADDPNARAQLASTYEYSLINALAFGACDLLVVDNTHITGKGWGGDTVGKVLNLCAQVNIDPEVVVFRVPLASVLKRNEMRSDDDKVPATVVDAAWQAHEDPDAWWRSYKGNITQAGGTSMWDAGAIEAEGK